MDKRAIARIVVGMGRGTGFLVSRDRLVLTALHVVADLEGSRRNERLKALADPIRLEFGDPHDHSTWKPDGPAVIVPELYSLQEDWAVLQFPGKIPEGVAPLALAGLDGVSDELTWKTFGFPDVAAHVGGDFGGPITSWETRIARLRSDAAAGVRMRGISGAPCVVGADAVALIDSALLDNELCQGGQLFAFQTREIARAAGGRIPFSQPVDVPFERDVRKLLPQDDLEALRDAANLLGIPDRPFPVDVARGVVLAEVERAADVLRVMAVPPDARNEIIDMVAAARLHHEAVDRLAEATRTFVPGVLRASAEETCTWYTRRACHKLTIDVWGNRLLQVDVAGLEENPASMPAGADPIQVAADGLLNLIRAKAQQQWTRPRFRTSALAGDPVARFCVALHNENRVAVVEALRGRLPNAHFLLVSPDELVLSDGDRTRVSTIAPHIQDEAGLLLAYDTVRTTTD